MPKSPDAFRTISEVADWLGIQAHVLRFWESKFTQVKPIKRAGGRRYYRPADMQLLGGIKKLLHEDGLTIKGVQKILREEGMSHVAAMSVPLEDESSDVRAPAKHTPAPRQVPEPEEAVVLPFEAKKEPELAGPDPAADGQPAETEKFNAAADQEAVTSQDDDGPDVNTAPAETSSAADNNATLDGPLQSKPEDVSEQADALNADAPVTVDDVSEPQESDLKTDSSREEDLTTAADVPDDATDDAEPAVIDTEATDDAVATAGNEQNGSGADEREELTEVEKEAFSSDMQDDSRDITAFGGRPDQSVDEDKEAPQSPSSTDEPMRDESTPLPAPLRQTEEAEASSTAAAGEQADAQVVPATPEAPEQEHADDDADAQEPDEPPRPKARDIGMPTVTPEAEIHAQGATLSRAARIRHLDPSIAQQVQPLLAQLSALRDRMSARANGAKPKS